MSLVHHVDISVWVVSVAELFVVADKHEMAQILKLKCYTDFVQSYY